MQGLVVDVGGQTVRITSERVVRIGRAVDDGILVSGETISRVHAELRPHPDGWTLVDVGSKHGTYVDGRQISELRVVTPLTVQLGVEGSGAVIVIKDAASNDEVAAVSSDRPNQSAD